MVELAEHDEVELLLFEARDAIVAELLCQRRSARVLREDRDLAEEIEDLAALGLIVRRLESLAHVAVPSFASMLMMLLVFSSTASIVMPPGSPVAVRYSSLSAKICSALMRLVRYGCVWKASM